MEGSLAFYILAAVTVGGAVAVVSLPNPLYSVLSLILTFLGLAGLYLTLNAQFIAMVQVIIYAGAIMVLFLFVVMLLNLGREEQQPLQLPFQKILGVVAGLTIFAAILNAAVVNFSLTGEKGLFPAERINELGNTEVMGRLLFTQYLLPFQAMGVLLFVGIIGAVVLARRRTN